MFCKHQDLGQYQISPPKNNLKKLKKCAIMLL
jgi:hypothetical protein